MKVWILSKDHVTGLLSMYQLFLSPSQGSHRILWLWGPHSPFQVFDGVRRANNINAYLRKVSAIFSYKFSAYLFIFLTCVFFFFWWIQCRGSWVVDLCCKKQRLFIFFYFAFVEICDSQPTTFMVCLFGFCLFFHITLKLHLVKNVEAKATLLNCSRILQCCTIPLFNVC